MATATTSIETDDASVRAFLETLFVQQTPVPVASGSAESAQELQHPSAGTLPLGLHPRCDAAHPLGTAHSATELQSALKVYSQLVSSLLLEVDEVLMAPDKALATGHLVVLSHAATLASAGAPAVTAAKSALPGPLRSAADSVLPAGLKAGRVPITIQMRLGKNDAGDPVVTHISLVFSLLAVLLPHVQLTPWQQQLAVQSQPKLLALLQQLGSAAGVAEDTLMSAAASWRAGTAVMQATVGQVLSAARQQAAHMWSSRSGDGDAP